MSIAWVCFAAHHRGGRQRGLRPTDAGFLVTSRFCCSINFAEYPADTKDLRANDRMIKPPDMYKTLRSFTHLKDGVSVVPTDLLVETPLEIIINREKHVLIMCSPEFTRELVVGFLFTESFISKASEVKSCLISQSEKGDGEQVIEARVTIPSDATSGMGDKGRRVSYSSCGICGKENYYDLKSGLGRVKSRQRFSMDILKKLPRKLEDLQRLYQKTGGAHAATLFDARGEPVFHCEDMGRHNALDKVIGHALINGIKSEDKVLVSSGRASLEMILKTARAGFPVFVAMSRPTSRAVEAAKFYNITLLDMAKNSNRIYSHLRRIETF